MKEASFNKQNEPVIDTDDLVMMIGEREIKLKEKMKLLQKARLMIDSSKSQNKEATSEELKKLRSSNQAFEKKNREMAQKIEKLRKNNPSREMTQKIKKLQKSNQVYEKKNREIIQEIEKLRNSNQVFEKENRETVQKMEESKNKIDSMPKRSSRKRNNKGQFTSRK